MMIPTVHLNGTGKQSLLEETLGAYVACRDARNAIRAMTVHGRDYYPQATEKDRTGEIPLRKAQDEMDARIAAIQRVMDDLEKLYEGIEAQGGAR